MKKIKDDYRKKLDNMSDEAHLKIVRLYETSSEVLHHLAKTSNDYVRIRVAQHKNTADETLYFLCDDVHNLVLKKIASNPHTSTKTLSKLYQKAIKVQTDRDRQAIMRDIAANEHTDVSILDKLAYNLCFHIVRAVIFNSTTTKKILMDLINSIERNKNSSSTLQAIASNFKMDPFILIAVLDLLRKGKIKSKLNILLHLSKNPQMPKWAKSVIFNKYPRIISWLK